MNSLNRRSFLRGISAAIAVPAMTSLVPARALAAGGSKIAGTSASGAPLRTAFIHFPNGAIPRAWWPDAAEQGDNELKLSKTLAPLESVKGSLQVLEGLDMEPAQPGADGAGDHARGNGTFLTLSLIHI